MENVCKEEINYFVLARALFYVGSVLEKYTENGFRRLHSRIKQTLSHFLASSCVTKCSKTFGNEPKKWCPTCQQWRTELANSHKNAFKSFDWSKTSSWSWPDDFKAVAPLFARQGWQSKPAASLNLGDLSNSLCILENCVEFSIAQNIIDKLRELRNGYFAHPQKMEVTDQKLESSFKVISTLFHENDLKNVVNTYECFTELENIRTATEISWVTVKQTLKDIQENINSQADANEEIITSIAEARNDLETQNENLKTTPAGT